MPDAASECPVDALASADGPVRVTLWHAMAAINQEVFEDLIDEYNASQSRVTVTATFQGGYEDNFEKYLTTLRSGGTLPDVIQLNETSLQQMVDSETIVPIEACVQAAGYDTSDFVPRLLDQYRIDGQLITMPFQLSNPVLYYDGNDLVAAGFDPDDPPRTFDELLTLSRALVDKGVTARGGIALEVDAWIVEQWLNMSGQPLVDHGNGREGRAEAALLDSPAATEVYDFLATLQREGLVVNSGRGTADAAIEKYLAVAFNDVAMTIGTSANLGEIYNQIDQVPDVDLRVAPLPGPSGGGTAIGGGSLYLVADAEPEVRAAAWDLMVWLNEPAQQARWAAETGYIPTRTSALEDPELMARWSERPGYRVAFDQLAGSGPIPGGGSPVIGPFLEVREAIESSLEGIYAGEDPRDAQSEAQAEADEAIADYNDRVAD